MDIITAFRIINHDVLDVIKATNILNEVASKKEDKPAFVRLKESPYILTEKTAYHSQVVTAHDLRQYRKRFNTTVLRNADATWLDALLKIDNKERD